MRDSFRTLVILVALVSLALMFFAFFLGDSFMVASWLFAFTAVTGVVIDWRSRA